MATCEEPKIQEDEAGFGFFCLWISLSAAGMLRMSKGPIRQAVIAMLSLLDFHIMRISGKARVEALFDKYVDNIRPEKHEGKQSHDVEIHQLTQIAESLLWL